MVWRVLGWLMIVYLLAGTALCCLVIMALGNGATGMGIDWSMVPLKLVVPLWMSITPTSLLLLVLAAIPAPYAFFARGRGIVKRRLLWIYILATAVTCVLLVGSFVAMLTAGPIRIGPSSTLMMSAGSVWPIAMVVGIAAAPIIGAVIALRGRLTDSPGFEVQPAVPAAHKAAPERD